MECEVLVRVLRLRARVAKKHRPCKHTASRMVSGVDPGSDFEWASNLRSVSQAWHWVGHRQERELVA